jgi:hypothetical protein
MKKFITLLCCIGSTLLFAQNTSSISTTEELPNWLVMLDNLNTTQITSGVLLDKITDFSNLTNYNTAENNISSRAHFTQGLSELYLASDQTRFISTTELKNRIASTTSANSVDVGIINTTFHRLNFNEDDAALSGVTFSNNQFSAVAGKPSFTVKKIMVVAPLKDIVSGSSVNFNFNDYFIFNNATTSINNLTVKFEEDMANIPVTIINNGSLVLSIKNIAYTTTGYKLLEFITTFTDNTTITTYAKIYVNVLQGKNELRATATASLCTELLRDRGVFPSTAQEIASSIPFQGYDESYAFNGKIEYTVFYHTKDKITQADNTEKKMLNPIIIVDGFDPKDKRKVQDCDCESDPVCKLANSDVIFSWSTYPSFQIVFNPTKHVSIEDSMEYDGINSTTGLPEKKRFMSELRALGYDIIVINQPTYNTVNTAGQAVNNVDGGADYIERNALTLVSFIKNFIKSQQTLAGSTEGLVLIGPSMGGQITRYALAYMEKKFAETNDATWKHNAYLWVSVDSPHLGANIPVGAQANIWFMAEKMYKVEAQESYNDLNSVAGKQQSIVNFEHARTSPDHNLQGSSFFSTYYNNLNSNGVAGSNGYPVSIPNTFRKIAMINGSLTGVKQGTEGQNFLYTRVYIRGLWPFQSSTITLARFQDSFMPSYGSTGTVFQGDGQNFNVGFNHWYVSHPRYTLNVNNQDIRGGLDVVPGGYLKVGKILKESIEGGASDGGYRSETRDYIESNSFISAFSSLGHLSPWQNWSNPLNTNLVCPTNKQTPFDSYFGANTNSEHTSFTKEGVEWLKKELQGIPQAPSFPIQAGLLNGPDFLCNATNTIYSFADVCKLPSAVVTWTVSPNLQMVSSTGYSVTVNQITNGEGIITATFQNGQTVTKTFWIGKPQITVLGDVMSQQPNVIRMQMQSDSNASLSEQGITATTWEKIAVNGTATNCATNYGGVIGSGFHLLKVTATNLCGTTVLMYDQDSLPVNYVGFDARTSESLNIYKIYPNPSNDIVNIDLKDQDYRPETNTAIIAELYDMMGQQKGMVEIINNIASINVSGLQKGIYVLKINIDGQIESHQVAIQ